MSTVKVRGVGRDQSDETGRTLFVFLSGEPSDAQLRSFHDFVSDWTPLSPPGSNEETGWVIERADSEPSRPMYYAGKDWSYDNLKAVRFARKQDAEAMCRYMFPGEPHRIADHMWCP